MTLFSRRTASVFGFQWLGNLLVLLLAAAWLQIPDSHVWQFVFSVVSGLVLAVAFCWLQVLTFSCLRGTVSGPLWLRIAAFAVIAALWLLLESWISSAGEHFWLYAGYWNSRLSPSHRVLFTPARIVMWLNILLAFVEWGITGIMLPIAIELSTQRWSKLTLKNFARPYSKLLYWVSVVLFCLIVSQLTSALVAWKPGSSVSGEIASVIFRLGVAYTVDIFLWCLLLVLIANWMRAALPAESAAADLP
jgi:hypothetical protein